MITTISRLNSSLEECFFSQSPCSHPVNGSRIETGLQGCKYLRNNCIHFTPGVPILPPQTLYILSISFGSNILKFILLSRSERSKWYVGVVGHICGPIDLQLCFHPQFSAARPCLFQILEQNPCLFQILEQNPSLTINSEGRGYLIFTNKSHGLSCWQLLCYCN